MSALPLEIINTYANLLIIVFVVYYFIRFRSKEKEIEKKSEKLDTDYHHVVDSALAKERTILEDATREANQIITGAQYVQQSSKDIVDQSLQKMVDDIQKESSDTTKRVDQALQNMVVEIHREALGATKEFMDSYHASLKQLASQSLNDFQAVAKDTEGDLKKSLGDFQAVSKELEGDLQKQLKEFHQTLLVDLKKELDEYKQTRLKEADQTIKRVIQTASQELLNKSLPLDDHQKLVLDALEKAKKEGVFD